MFKVIVDTRENPKFRWDFSIIEKCIGTEIRKLDTGDYSIEGLEDVLAIERKRSTGEIAMNIGIDKERFIAELERMSKFKYKYLLLEFTMEDVNNFPKKSGIAVWRWKGLRITSKYMAKCLSSYKEKYGIEVIYCTSQEEANDRAIQIIQMVYEEEVVKKQNS